MSALFTFKHVLLAFSRNYTNGRLGRIKGVKVHGVETGFLQACKRTQIEKKRLHAQACLGSA
jgi:hypothetical protein